LYYNWDIVEVSDFVLKDAIHKLYKEDGISSKI
jgi:hypothetical protein